MRAISTISPQAPSKIDPEALLMKAVESGQSVETLERLLALRERLQAEYAAGQYRQALLAFQAECPKIEKSKIVFDKPEKGGGERYRYATLEAIQDVTKPILHNYGFSFDFDTVCEANAVIVIMTIAHIAGHEKKSSFRVPIDPKAYMTDPQKYEAAMSFAQRICYRNGFGLVTGTNDNNTEEQLPVGKAPPPTEPPEPPEPPIGVTSAAHRALEARISELGLDREGVKTWCTRHHQVEHFPDLTAAQQRDLMTRLPGFAVQKILRQIPMMGISDLEALIKTPPDWLKPMTQMDTVLEAADKRLTALQAAPAPEQEDPTALQAAPAPEQEDPTFGGDFQEQIAG